MPIKYKCGFSIAGYVYDQETQLYYLQSRYYNPERGRFLNADALVSTGQGFSGYNMFAYCNNNPVKLVDFGGSIPRELFAMSTCGGGGYAFIAYNSAKKYDKTKELSYQNNGPDNGAQIVDSYKVKNPVVMYKYIAENRGDEIAGSSTGVVYEWVVHDIAYEFGKVLNKFGFSEQGNSFMVKGQTLDVGRTIYSDSHGELSLLMWATYGIVSPFTATYDFYVHKRR